MSPDIEFTSERSVNSCGCLEGDTKCSVKMFGDDETVPKGSFGAFIAKDRPNLAQELQTVKSEIEAIKIPVGRLEKCNLNLEKDVEILKDHKKL